MNIEFDETKRQITLEDRGLDFARFGELDEGPTFSRKIRGMNNPNRDIRLTVYWMGGW